MILLKEHKEALLHYIDTFPNRWKAEIIKDWNSFASCTPTLRVLRNQYGPSWLLNLTAVKVRGSKVRCVCGPLRPPHTTNECKYTPQD